MSNSVSRPAGRGHYEEETSNSSSVFSASEPGRRGCKLVATDRQVTLSSAEPCSTYSCAALRWKPPTLDSQASSPVRDSFAAHPGCSRLAPQSRVALTRTAQFLAGSPCWQSDYGPS